MKQLLSIALLFSFAYLGACQSSGNAGNEGTIKETLSVDQFESKLKEIPDAQLVDVRTPGEYLNGHLKNAVNMNVNGSDYEQQFSTLDKEKPVFVYCLSGGRSSGAAKILQKMGFKVIYNMDGGVLKWEGAGKPLVQGNTSSKPTGMTNEEFEKNVRQKQFVLVDYNAPWCEPCKKMMPIMESIAGKKKDKMALLKIDADLNKALLKEKGIAGIPYLELYENGKLVWKHDGYIDEQQLLAETKL